MHYRDTEKQNQVEKQKYSTAKDQSHLNICLQVNPIEEPRLFIQIPSHLHSASLLLCGDMTSPHLWLIRFSIPISFGGNVMILDYASEVISTAAYA